jgi:hypothetical protein
MLRLVDTRATSQLRTVGLCGVCGLQRDLSIRNFSTPYRTVLLLTSGSARRFRLASITLQAVVAALTSLLQRGLLILLSYCTVVRYIGFEHGFYD